MREERETREKKDEEYEEESPNTLDNKKGGVSEHKCGLPKITNDHQSS